MKEYRFPFSKEVAKTIRIDGMDARTFQTVENLAVYLHDQWSDCAALPVSFFKFAMRLTVDSLLHEEDAGWFVLLKDGQSSFQIFH